VSLKPLDRKALQHHPLPHVADGDKDSKGRILVIAGSREVPGAAVLTATAAMRAGAGKLKIATVASVAVQVGIAMPEAMVVGLAEDDDGGFAPDSLVFLREDANKVDAVIAGWTEGLQLMTVGEVARFWIPAKLAYAGDASKPQGMLVFDIQLIAIK